MVFSCMWGSAPLVARGFNQHDAAGLVVDDIAGLGGDPGILGARHGDSR
jgi:hypothetical protein